jgi:uncharacterized protein (TIGR02646 family)
MLARATDDAKSFFKTPPAKRSQERYLFKNIWEETREALETLFHNKCAYCESPLIPGEGLIEHFRPKIEALGLDGTSDPDWYWWLAYRWENLYLSCPTCAGNKLNLFPVVGNRAPINSVGPKLKEEHALLLDPCTDLPEVHLQFASDGRVHGIPHYDAKVRARYNRRNPGEITIKTLGLNRSHLVDTRRAVAQDIKALYDSLISMPSESPSDKFRYFLHPSNTFAAMRRQMTAQLIHTTSKRLLNSNSALAANISALSTYLMSELSVLRLQAKPATTSKKKPASKKKPTKRAAKPVISNVKVTFQYETAYLQKIEIQNFRAIQDVSLKFTETMKKGVGWKMLLGENGAGKSSILKAAALALMGEKFYKEHGERLRLTPKHIFNRKTKQKDGLIRVELTKGTYEVRFKRPTTKESTPEFVSDVGTMNIFLRGYGATRLLSSENAKDVEARAKEIMNVENLFSPFARLSDANRWLVNLDKAQFDSAGLTLKDLLHLEGIKKPLSKKGKQVYLDVGYGPLPLEEQSDGYQSVLALVTDILAGVPGALHDKQQASGIVLLDEIDAHLHPRWKMRIVGRLREAFPNIQFLSTTHEPLCLKGLGEMEIAVMQRAGNQITVRDDIPSPAELRIDQLLTSQLFGLDSTIDPDIDGKFHEYYELLAMHRRTRKQESRLQTLKGELKRYNKLGYTRRDQLVYEVIDDYLANEGKIANFEDRTKFREETKKQVRDIWMSINAQRDVR